MKAIEVDYDRFSNHKRNLYTPDWQRIDVTLGYLTNRNREFPKPKVLNIMLQIATKLSKGIPHVRVDLYIVNNKVYFGESTFYHGSGYEKFNPEQWDYTFGSWITLPKKTM